MSNATRTRIASGLAATLLLPALALAGTPTIDGTFGPGEWPTPVATQVYATAFGDHTNMGQFGGGSELDALHLDNDADNLYIGITGNLENNGNCIVIFLDTDGAAGGSNILITREGFGLGDPVPGLPRYLTGDAGEGDGLNFLTFDAGFNPDYVFGFSGGSPRGVQLTTFYLANLTTIEPDPNNQVNTVLGLATAGNPTASGATPGSLSNFFPGSNPGGILFSANNLNVAGVEGAGGGPIAMNDPLTATTGFEIAIPLASLGLADGSDVCVFAAVSGADGFLSNQILPTVPSDGVNGRDNFGLPPVDFELDVPGQQFVCYTVAVSACVGDLTGDGRTDLSDLGVLFGCWQTPCGDLTGDNNTDLADLGVLFGDWNCGV